MLQIFGQIQRPAALGGFNASPGIAIGQLINISLRGLVAIGALYALFNFIFAGYGFLSAGDDPKKVQAAWGKIWQSVLGLAVIAGSFTLAAIFGRILFGPSGWTFFLRPELPTL